jgi:hypothetical protein
MPGDRRLLRSLLAAFLAVAVALVISACGYSSTSKDVAEGQTVKLGHLEYTVVFSRYLNPNDNEDAAYLVGQPPAPTTTVSSFKFKTGIMPPTSCRARCG